MKKFFLFIFIFLFSIKVNALADNAKSAILIGIYCKNTLRVQFGACFCIFWSSICQNSCFRELELSTQRIVGFAVTNDHELAIAEHLSAFAVRLFARYVLDSLFLPFAYCFTETAACIGLADRDS